MLLATILYEDQLAVQAKHFGLHELVLRCLADRFPVRIDELRAMFAAIPRKGNRNVRKDCDDRRQRHLNRSKILVAVYDSDKIRDVVPSAADCRSSRREVLRSTSAWGKDLTIVFLEQNIESVLTAIAEAMNHPPLSDKPRPEARDKLLLAAAWGPEAVRGRVLEAVPSLQYLIDKLAREVAAHLLARP